MGVMWNGVQRCGGMIRIMVDVKCGATDVELMLPDMVRLKCRKISVVWNTAWCGMLRNAGCGKLRCDVKCGDVELW